MDFLSTTSQKEMNLDKFNFIQAGRLKEAYDHSKNGQDCGVYVCFYIEKILEGKGNVSGPVNANEYREKILSDVVGYCNPFDDKNHELRGGCKSDEPRSLETSRIDWIECEACRQWWHKACANIDNPEEYNCQPKSIPAASTALSQGADEISSD